MNQDQVLSLVRWALTSFGGYFIGRGWVNAEQAAMIGGVAAALVPLVWTMFAHTNAAKVDAAAAVPGARVVAPPEIANKSSSPDVLSSDSAKITLVKSK